VGLLASIASPRIAIAVAGCSSWSPRWRCRGAPARRNRSQSRP